MHTFASRDAHSPVHLDDLSDFLFDQNVNYNTAKRSTKWATKLDLEKVIM